jgi:hypothetical protein
MSSDYASFGYLDDPAVGLSVSRFWLPPGP